MVVAKQGVPNLSPVLDSSLKVKQVILIFTDYFTEEASWLEAVYLRDNLKVQRWKISDAFHY